MELGNKIVLIPGVFANCILEHDVDAILDNETFEREETTHPQGVFTRFWLTKSGLVIERWTEVYRKRVES